MNTPSILTYTDFKAILVLIAGVCGGIYLFSRGFRLLQRRGLILNTPLAKIRSASLGLVEVSGLAEGPYTIPAPITGMPCYYHRTLVWQMKQDGKSNKWVKIVEESLHVPFYLDDNTGRVLINPIGAEMDLHRDFGEEYDSSFFSSRPELPANVAGFLARRGITNDKKLKVEEYSIKPKNALFVLGTLAENPGLTVNAMPVRAISGVAADLDLDVPGMLASTQEGQAAPVGFERGSQKVISSNRAEAPEIIRLSAQPAPGSSAEMTQQGKIAAAMLKAGISNPAAWAMVGIEPPHPSLNSPTAPAAASAHPFDLHPKTVLMKGGNNSAFFVSWRRQRDVVKSLGWKSALMIFGGPILTLLCLYILCAEIGWL